MKVYRLLTGKDDATFCRRVTEALLAGWELYGNPTMTHTPDGIYVGQAIVKETDAEYDEQKALSSY